MLPYITVSGRTVDSDGIPVPNVEISIPTLWSPNREFRSGGLIISSDAQGGYSFRIPSSTYNVRLSPTDSNNQFGATEYLDVELTADTVRDFIIESANTLSARKASIRLK